MKLSRTQLAAMGEIAGSISGRLRFGNGFGRYNVALRALMMRPSPPVIREIVGDYEHWSLTEAGRLALRKEAPDARK